MAWYVIDRSAFYINGGSRPAPRTLYLVDSRPFGNGSLFCTASGDGCQYVVHAKAQSTATRPNAGKNNAVDASNVYIFLPLVPGGSGIVLGSK